jgi:hypothetical protein
MHNSVSMVGLSVETVARVNKLPNFPLEFSAHISPIIIISETTDSGQNNRDVNTLITHLARPWSPCLGRGPLQRVGLRLRPECQPDFLS